MIPEKFIPDENVLAYGAVSRIVSPLFVDSSRTLWMVFACASTRCNVTRRCPIIWAYSSVKLGAALHRFALSFSTDLLLQVFSLTHEGAFRREQTCTRVSRDLLGRSGSVILSDCPSKSSIDKWTLQGNVRRFSCKGASQGLMKHESSGLCLTTTNLKSGADVRVEVCDSQNPHQVWRFIRQ